MKLSDSAWKIGILLFVVALLLRLFVAVFSPGTDDVQNFVHTARLSQQGLVVYQHQPAYPYSPLYAWILASTLTVTDWIGLPPGFSVRLPPIFADSVMSVLIFLVARQLNLKTAHQIGWLYVFNPITIMIASHHGQFDSLAYLLAVLALWLHQFPYVSALFLGIGGGIKVTPLFLAPAWLPGLPRLRQRFAFTLLALLPFSLAFLIGWCMSPVAFTENVLGYRTFAEGGWGYNFVTLLIERVARRLDIEFILRLCWIIRSLHQYILIGGILLTVRLTRQQVFFKRALLIQFSVQLFAGRWGHEYTAWIVPLAVLSNQRGLLPWGGLTILWMLIAYVGFTAIGTRQDSLFRAATIVGFLSWLALGLWFTSNLLDTCRLRLHWFRAPIFRS